MHGKIVRKLLAFSLKAVSIVLACTVASVSCGKETEKGSFTEKVSKIRYVEQYEDGRARMTCSGGEYSATFDYEILPSELAPEFAEDWKSKMSAHALYYAYGEDGGPNEMISKQLGIENVTEANGFIRVKVNCNGLESGVYTGKYDVDIFLRFYDGGIETKFPEVRTICRKEFVDNKFKQYCCSSSSNIDTDGDGEISEYEAKAVVKIECPSFGITSLDDISLFSNLEYLDASLNRIGSLDLSDCPHLKTVLVSGDSLQALNLSGLSALETLDCSSNKLGTLDVSGLTSLKTIDCSSNKIDTLNLKNNKALTELNCSSNNLVSLDLKNNVLLEVLLCGRNSLPELYLSMLTSLEIINISLNTALTMLDVSNTSLSTLDVSSNTSLMTLTLNEGLTVTGPLNIGCLVEIGGVQGLIYSSTSSKTMLVSKSETSATWSNALAWCTKLGTGSKWYLPSIEELLTIYDNKAKLTSCGIAFQPTSYWSSTESGSDTAYRMRIYNGSTYTNKKGSMYYVRAVRAL